jgi:hypothetical protein
LEKHGEYVHSPQGKEISNTETLNSIPFPHSFITLLNLKMSDSKRSPDRGPYSFIAEESEDIVWDLPDVGNEKGKGKGGSPMAVKKKGKDDTKQLLSDDNDNDSNDESAFNTLRRGVWKECHELVFLGRVNTRPSRFIIVCTLKGGGGGGNLVQGWF